MAEHKSSKNHLPRNTNMRSNITVAIAFAWLSSNASAEPFASIQFGWKLSDLKYAYANAVLKELNPANSRDDEKEIQLTGEGIDGAINIRFADFSKRSCILSKSSQSPKRSLDSIVADCSKSGVKDFTPDSAEIERITWIPNKPITTSKYISKYGEPDTTYINDMMESILSWRYRRVDITYNTKTATITRVEFSPSEYDMFECATANTQSKPSCDLWKNQIQARTKNERSKLLMEWLKK